ncbi:MAG: glycerol-3-phosphate dehydrogenase/oxidase [Fibrobacterota bacterium]
MNPLRDPVRDALKKGVDILVVGGGINGAGVFRDAALRGLSVGLIEKNDFGWGTSSRSSKLIHGGVRYLEHMEFGLVLESSIERTLLSRLMPDLVQPAPFVIPVYKGDRHGLFMMDFGLWLYDLLALFRNFHLHRRLGRKALRAMLPELKEKGLTGGVLYYDCRVNDARLVINNVVSGMEQNGHALNYTQAIRVIKEEGRIRAVTARDALSGETFDIPCRVLISATGPWTNGFYPLVEGQPRQVLRLTKGIHLVFPQKHFRTETALVITSNDDRRIVFVIPWEEYTLVGTTDTDFDGDPDHVYSEKEDVDYLLRLVNGYFPGLALAPRDAISAFAGLRPLLLKRGSASSVSRKDKILKGPSGAYYIGGGKLTTYRCIAEKAVDKAVWDLAPEKRAAGLKCRTGKEPLISKPEGLSCLGPSRLRDAGLQNDTLDYLCARYGRGSLTLIELAASDRVLAERIVPELPFVYAEIPYGVKHEMLMTVTDFFRLRTEIFLKAHDNGRAALRKAVTLLGRARDFTDMEMERQETEYRTYLDRNLSCLS